MAQSMPKIQEDKVSRIAEFVDKPQDPSVTKRWAQRSERSAHIYPFILVKEEDLVRSAWKQLLSTIEMELFDELKAIRSGTAAEWNARPDFAWILHHSKGIKGRLIPQNESGLIGNDTSLAALQEARKVVEKQLNNGLVERALNFLSTLEGILVSLEPHQLSQLGKLPRLLPLTSDVDSLWFEWIFPHYRIGFTIAPSGADTGWYLVSDEEFGNMNAAGSFSEHDIGPLLKWLVAFIILHA